MVVGEDGKKQLIYSYSKLQDRYHDHMKAVGFHGFERGKEGALCTLPLSAVGGVKVRAPCRGLKPKTQPRKNCKHLKSVLHFYVFAARVFGGNR